MQVQSINNTHTSKSRPSFKNWQRIVYKPNTNEFCENIKHLNTTWLFRPSAKYWKDLALYVTQKFKNVPKVNTYVYGCSDGSDAYSFIFALNTILKNDIQKYLPIIAKDYDAEAIKKCLKSELYLNDVEIAEINNITNFDNYFEKISDSKPITKKEETGYEFLQGNPLYRINDSLRKNVIFEEADLTKDYINIEPENSIVFARNFWPYLTEHSRNLLAHNLSNILDGNSMLILGTFDMGKTHYNRLISEGFKLSPIDCCFIKNP